MGAANYLYCLQNRVTEKVIPTKNQRLTSCRNTLGYMLVNYIDVCCNIEYIYWYITNISYHQ